MAGEEGLAFEICLSALPDVVANRPMPFLKKAFIVAPRTERLAREVKSFSSKTKRNILPARGVVSDSTVLVASKLSFGPFYV